MSKMRTMQHNSRTNAKGKTHGTKHNDRNFDVNKASNIDKAKARQNIYWHCYPKEKMTFEQAELRFYEETFGEQLRLTNEAYLRNGHPERCKTMEEWKQIRRNAPEETVMQVGKMEGHIDRVRLYFCYKDYEKALNQWNQEHGNPFTILTTALHADEAVPHVQSRRVWHYTDDKGVVRIGQEKALAAAGVQLPDPTKKEGKHNNRKMTFDAMCRGMWLEVLHKRGLDIEQVPVPDGKHNMDKDEMIREKHKRLAAEIEKMEAQIAELQTEIEISETVVDNNYEIAKIYEQESDEVQGELLQAREELSSVRKDVDALIAQKSSLEQELPALKAQISDAHNEILGAREELEVVNQAIKKRNGEGEKQFGMTEWKRRIADSRNQMQEQKTENLLAKFAQMLIDKFPPIRQLWENFLREHNQRDKRQTKKRDEPTK